jgi:hypothetical protein
VNSTTDLENFSRLIESITPWLDQVVIIGGWAHRLYRLHSSARQVDYPALMTLDTDVAVPARLDVSQQDIHERLLANGFCPDPLGDQQPPATHYRLRDSESGFYAEFLTPLVGSEYSRDGKRKATATIGGVASQRIRHLEILLNTPWQLTIDSSNGFSVLLGARRIQVPNPASFLAQKILIHSRRSQEDRAKDILYMHDTLEIFSEGMKELNDIWRKILRPKLSAKNIRTIEGGPRELFGFVNDSFRESARIAVGRRLSPQSIQELCAFGLGQVFL